MSCSVDALSFVVCVLFHCSHISGRVLTFGIHQLTTPVLHTTTRSNTRSMSGGRWSSPELISSLECSLPKWLCSDCSMCTPFAALSSRYVVIILEKCREFRFVFWSLMRALRRYAEALVVAANEALTNSIWSHAVHTIHRV